MTSLAEYATKHPGRSARCSICSLDPALVTEINEALRAGVAPSVVCQWLEDDKKIERHSRLVQYHKGQRHHLQNEDS